MGFQHQPIKTVSEGWVVDCSCRARKSNLWIFLLDMVAVLVEVALLPILAQGPPPI